jgi:hypothetical protein
MLDNYNRYLIESYREYGQAWRHEDNLLHRMISISLPLSVTALGVPYVYKEVPMLLSLLGGLILMIFWIVLCQAIYIRMQIKFEVMGIIESHLDIPGHGHFSRLREELFGNLVTIQRIYKGVFCLYLFVVIMIGLDEYGPELPELYGNNPYLLASVGIIFIILVPASWLAIRRAQRTIKPCNSTTLENIIKSLEQKKQDSQSCD